MAAGRARALQVIDPVLTSVARQFKSQGLVYDRLCPRIQVQNESGLYPVYTKDFWFTNDPDNKKADRDETKEIHIEYSTESYLVDEYAYKVSISDRERANSLSALRYESSLVNNLMLRQALAREKRLADLLRETTDGDLSSGAAPSTNWNDDAATIETDIVVAKEAIYDLTGMTPNTIVLPWKVANAVAKQADIREVLKYTVNGQQIISTGEGILPAQLWGLQVIVPMGLRNTANPDGGTFSGAEIWGDDVRVLHVDSNAGWGIPSVAYAFQTKGPTVARWRENDPDVEYIRVKEIVDEKVVAPDLGYVIQDVLS